MSDSIMQFNPVPGVSLVDEMRKWATLNQANAQTGLIGQQAQGASLQNQVLGARLNAYQGMGAIGGQSGQQPSGGAIGQQPEAGGLPPPTTGPGGQVISGIAYPDDLVQARQLAILDGKDAPGATKSIFDQRSARLSQFINGVMGPNGEPPTAPVWNDLVTRLHDTGYLSTVDVARSLNHPELAPRIATALAPIADQPWLKAAQTGAEQGAQAPYRFREVTETLPDGSTQKRTVRESTIPGAPAGGAGGAMGPPAAATELPPAAQGFLRALSPSEASAHNVRYVPPGSDRPATFDPSQGHPGQGAAGLFQFEPDTWKKAAAGAHVDPGDMSQENQERAAWWLAQRTYGDATGNDLLHDLNQGGHERQITAALRTQWPSLQGGSQQNAVGATFPQRLPVAVNGHQASVDTGAGPGVAAGPVELSPQVQKLADFDLKTQIPEDQQTNAANVTAGLNANKASLTMKEIRDQLPDAPTGSFGQERTALNNFAQTFGGPWAQRLTQVATGFQPGDTAKMQELNKLFLNNVVSQEQAVGNVRIGAMFTNYFAKASPSIDMQRPAIKDILNLGLVGQQMAKDFADASNNHFNAARDVTANSLAAGQYERYQPLTKMEAQWTAPTSIHHPDVYAAAAKMLNGGAPADAFKGLSREQQVEAVHIIARTDPTATVAGRRPSP